MTLEPWRLLVVAWMLWLIAFTVVEGLGRQVCRMPTRRWTAAASPGRERALRDEFRARASYCLDQTPWYAWTMRALVLVALALPLTASWLTRRQRALLRNLVLVGTLGVTLGSMMAVRWLYDWMA
jgi:hypothetical protein